MRDKYNRKLFALWIKSRMSHGVIAGCNFRGFAGKVRAAKNSNYWWLDRDDHTASAPPDEQGLDPVFGHDKTTWQIIAPFT